jgi:hypothetical protein
LLGGCASAPSRAPAPLDHLAALRGDYFPIASRANGRRYHIYVRPARSYAEAPQRTYPTRICSTAIPTFPMLAPQHLFLTYDDKLPEAILVGVAFGSFAPPSNSRGPDFGPKRSLPAFPEPS